MPPAVPRATYRLQLTAEFGFARAAAVVPYLGALGISHLYASPFLKARAGSQHGYDIIDHNTLNPEFGGEEGFALLSDALAAHDMGLILDFVPNHMGIGHADNTWWLDVLEWGPKSPFADTFDIDWNTLPYRPQGGLLLPILGKPYGEALEQGEIELRFDAAEGSFSFWYFDHRLPVRPNRYAEILRAVIGFAGAAEMPAGKALLDIAKRHADPGRPTRADAPAMKLAIAAVDGGAQVIETGLAAYRSDPSDPSRTVVLHRLLERQHYRLAHWRVAISEVNYRRFFDINDLAGIRVETPRTFRVVHRKVAELIAAGKLHGLRLDHIDGLYDPMQYCRRLQRLINDHRPPTTPAPFYVTVEKILAPDETMPRLAGVAGTTGYDVLNVLSRVLLDNNGLSSLEQTWQTHAAPSRNFAQMVEDSKARILDATMASEFTVLTRLLARIAAGHWPSRDFTLDRLRAAFELFVVYFPVYRTYIANDVVSDADRATIARAITAAREHWYGSDIAIFDFLQDALTLDLVAPGRAGYSRARVTRFAAKVQQFTGPVTAKSIEDTAFYRYHRLLALNEVGNDPSLPALSIEAFHRLMAARTRQNPHAMTATATHDTKRGEDARMRLLALSELAQDWAQAVRGWSAMNATLVEQQARRRAPSRAHEYMIYQALLGAWPLGVRDNNFLERMQAYAVKAAREGKQETSWANPDETYENALTGFIAKLLDEALSRVFIEEFTGFARRLGLLGALNSLAQLTLKATIPGVPDFYQGCELWDLALVDPDNRRPVDFSARARQLQDAAGDAPAGDWHDGRMKFALTRQLLALRREYPALFADGSYEPVNVNGAHRDHVVAFARRHRGDAIIVAAGRQFAPFTDGGRQWPRAADWDAELDLAGYRVTRSVLNGVTQPSTAALTDLFHAAPVAVLQAQTR
jgi:(1->4)-alpha-D-glucan 1-alpha-D-glucosylmutase